ncbi:MAG: Ureidoglycolate lyase [Phycisphaerales bacterium]|nr:Ureidoglycolate lyase [Phycisphaerales bacterium]
MRIVRFLSGGTEHLGSLVEGDDATAREIDGLLLDGPAGWNLTGRILRVEQLLAPLVPTDILCIGLNYREHAKESNSEVPDNPMLFIKSSNALNHPGGPIPIPRRSTDIDYEGELCVVIGKTAKNVSKAEALSYVLGYTCANDVSARDWQKQKKLNGGQFARGKSFDGFCPLGPWLVTADEVPNPNALKLRTLVNGRVLQDHTTADMIFDVPTLIESLSSTMTLRPGAVILTGTPQGVGAARTPPVWLTPGDTVAVEIEGIGRLENPVTAEA